ncbi:MAG: DoxX family protein [Anaerolineae bacterium]|nr:DoxX family protein [Anaerolineae bacterium]MDW8099435.1 DoxX family protein [Anaerolineae bacterium]
MNILLWLLQILLGVYFFFTGIVHFIVPPGLPAPMAWMYELSPGLHYLSGTAEILAGLGLILPGLTRIQTRLTPLAAFGLVLVMLGAAIWHLLRNEFSNIAMNLILAGLSGFVAYGRWRLSPLKAKGAQP